MGFSAKASARRSVRRPGEAYLQSRLATGEWAVRWAWHMARALTDQQRRLWFHVLSCQLFKHAHEADGWVPVSSTAMRRDARGVDVEHLINVGLLECQPFSQAEHRCRRFRLPASLMAQYNQAMSQDDPFAPRYDLFTGEPVGPVLPQKYRCHGHPLPLLIRQTIDAISPHGMFNVMAAAEYVQQLRRQAEENPSKINLARWQNDFHCLSAIRAQVSQMDSMGIARFPIPYCVTATGRLAFVGGGTMSCSSAMKRAGYSGLSVTNYDIKSSQATILRDMLNELEIDATWLEYYLAGDKEEYANEAGLPVKVWKTVLYALLMGARLPHPSTAAMSKGEIARAVWRVHGPEGFESGYAKLYKTICPLAKAIRHWHERIILDLEGGQRGRGRPRHHRNDVGMPFINDPADCPWQRAAKLAAHLLQGREAYFIDHLILTGVRHGFVPIAHEHDGIVTWGSISDQAVQEVRQATNIVTLQLIEKPF